MYEISSRISWQFVPNDNCVILYNSDSKDFSRLDGVAFEIWNLIISKRDKDRIVEAISSKYEVSKESINVDIESFFEDMVFQGVLDKL